MRLGADLNRGHTRSCGCYRSAVTTASNLSHGMSKSPTYSVWCNMIRRCRNPNDAAFDRYGGRGIAVCARWDRFEEFLADMGEVPSVKHSIDRIDNDGNYEPANCRWTTDIVQANNSRKNVHATIDGITMTVAQWCRHMGLRNGAVRQRIHRGMSPESAITTPFRTSPSR